MATYSLKRFAQPEVLKSIHTDNLQRFLHPYTDYLTARGFTFQTDGNGHLDYVLLCRILMQPTEGIPSAMVDALYFVHEVSDDDLFDDLLTIAQNAKVDVPGDSTPADLAVLLWLKDPELIKRPHAETMMLKPKNFVSYQSISGKGKNIDLSDSNIRALEADMDQWFEQNKRGTGCTVLPFDMPNEGKVYFLVRHGMPFKREGTIEAGETGSVFYRPEFHDVVIYDREANELQIFNKSLSKKERNMYLAAFGLRFFGNAEYFPNADKYTLQPLVADGVDSLSCHDIPGIEDIRLVELQLQSRGRYNERSTFRSKNLFAGWEERGMDMPRFGNLVSASFQVKFENSAKLRTIKIKTPNVASFDRKEDAHVIDLWMRARGFIKQQEQTQKDESPSNDAVEQTAVAYA